MILYDLYDDTYEVRNWKGYNDFFGLGGSNLMDMRDADGASPQVHGRGGLQAESEEEGHGHGVGLGPDSEPWLAGYRYELLDR